MKSYFTKKEQIVILIVIVLIVSILGFKFLSNNLTGKGKDLEEIVINLDENEGFPDNDKDNQNKLQDIEDGEEYKGNIIVHISGQVISPGIVELPFGKRLIDAVDLLGGLTPDADGDRINLAKKLQDEEKVYIPKVGEELEESVVAMVEASNEPGIGFLENTNGTTNKVDLNICTKEELNSLPGIGEVLSTRILEYREDNLFKSIEDIQNVSGIGVKKYEGLKDFIIVK